jgi:hypothetical protein
MKPLRPCLACRDVNACVRAAVQESLYLTAKREKLGKPVERGHVLPQTTKEPGASDLATMCLVSVRVYALPLGVCVWRSVHLSESRLFAQASASACRRTTRRA